MDYAAAVTRATTDQGLDPVIECLTAEGVQHALEQTGGFCMALSIPGNDGTYVVAGEGDGNYVLCFYPGAAWGEGGEEQVLLEQPTLDELVTHLKGNAAK